MSAESLSEKTRIGTLADWKIDTMYHARTNRRWTWAIDYPISKFAIIGTRDFSSNAAARRDAYRCIRVLVRGAVR